MQSIEDALQEMVSSGEYAFTNFDNNKDFTTFDVSLSTEEKTKNLLNICLVIFFIYTAYIIQESKVFNTRTTIYLCILICIFLLFIKLNVSKENFTYFIDWINKIFFKMKPIESEKNDEIKNLIM